MSATVPLRTFVVGGESSIGEATVRLLARQRVRVAFTGADDPRAEELAQDTGAVFVRADIATHGGASAAVAEATDVLAGLDGLVLSVAEPAQVPLSETSDELWDSQLEANLFGPLRCAVAALGALRDSQGAIVNVASGTAVWPEVSLGAYSVAKRGLLWATHMLAVEAAQAGVRVNCVSPGDTSSTRSSIDDGPRQGDPVIPPLGRLADPEEIAEVIAFLLSPGSRFVTGANLVADGGMRASLRAGKVFA